MEQLKPFLQSFPVQDGEQLVVDYLAVDQSNPNRPEGGAFTLAGHNINNTVRTVTGITTLHEQTNLILILRRYVTGNPERRSAGDFIFNYCRWVNWCQAMRNTSERNPLIPSFSMDGDDVIRADGGMIAIADVEKGENLDEFAIQLHLEFSTIYG